MSTLKYSIITSGLLVSGSLFSQGAEQKVATSGTNMLFVAMAVLASVLLLVIMILSGVLRTAVKTKIREMMSVSIPVPCCLL